MEQPHGTGLLKQGVLILRPGNHRMVIRRLREKRTAQSSATGIRLPGKVLEGDFFRAEWAGGSGDTDKPEVISAD